MRLTLATTNPQKWERMPSEGPKPWAAFNVYLQLGPERTVDLTWKLITGEPLESVRRATGRFQTWAATWGWLSRAHAWDEFLAAEARRAMIQQTEENARIRIRNLTNTQNQMMLVLKQADLGNLDSTEARKLLPQVVRALEMTAESLREEFGVGARPTRGLQVVADLGGIRRVEDFDDDELLLSILAEKAGLPEGTDLSRYRINGKGTLVRIEESSPSQSNGVR